jgi:hypothetical protein
MYQTTGIKQYVKHDVDLHGRGLRTESSSHQLRDLSIRKNINNLNKLREVMDTANQRYLSVQQDVLASYVDRGQLEQLSRPSILATGRRVPGLHIDDPRLVATLNAILCFAYLVGKGLFHTSDLLGDVQRSAGRTFALVGGVLTNFNSGALTGGTYQIAGAFQFPGAAITTNAANIVLDGAGSQIVNQLGADALANLSQIAAGGVLTIEGGRDFSTTAGQAFSNLGALTVGAGSTFSVMGGFINFAKMTLFRVSLVEHGRRMD